MGALVAAHRTRRARLALETELILDDDQPEIDTSMGWDSERIYRRITSQSIAWTPFLANTKYYCHREERDGFTISQLHSGES